MTYRVYFNRWADAPLVWSVDCGTQATETNVREVRLEGVTAVTRSGPGDNVKSPTVWIEVEGKLSVVGEVATIRAARQSAKARAA